MRWILPPWKAACNQPTTARRRGDHATDCARCHGKRLSQLPEVRFSELRQNGASFLWLLREATMLFPISLDCCYPLFTDTVSRVLVQYMIPGDLVVLFHTWSGRGCFSRVLCAGTRGGPAQDGSQVTGWISSLALEQFARESRAAHSNEQRLTLLSLASKVRVLINVLCFLVPPRG